MTNKHLAFIEEYMSNGYKGPAAYKKVYDVSSNKRAADGAYAMLKRDDIIEEIHKRQEELAKKNDIKKSELAMFLRQIIDTDIADFMRVEKYTELVPKLDVNTGEMYEEEVEKRRIVPTPTEELTPEQRKMIKSIEETKFGIRYILYDKTDSVKELNKMLGFYNEEIKINTAVDTGYLKDKSFEELKELLQELDKEKEIEEE